MNKEYEARDLAALDAEQKYAMLSDENKERVQFIIAYLRESQYIALQSFYSLPLAHQSRG